MNSKILLTLLAIMVVAVAILWWKSSRLSSSRSAAGASSGISLSTDPSPLRPGKATFIIDVKDKSGKPVDNAIVSFDINMTTMNMGTQQGSATPLGKGRYSAVGNMSMRGPWRVRTSVQIPDGSTDSKDFIVNVP